jgi:hypothetical protein
MSDGVETEGIERPSWRFWSTAESVRDGVPSVMAISETVAAVAFYWWVALHVGLLLPLLIGIIVAPMVLLRSEQSVELGLRWFLAFESKLGVLLDRFPRASTIVVTAAALIAVIPAAHLATGYFEINSWKPISRGIYLVALAVFSGMVIPAVIIGGYAATTALIVSILIRIAATSVHLRAGLRRLPTNFRSLTICTSPAQIPELVPGISDSGSDFNFRHILTGISLKDWRGSLTYLIVAVMIFVSWFYRISIKSTTWFWWPLAFLLGDLRLARNPELFKWKTTGRLWAKASIASSLVALFVFVCSNFEFSKAILEKNPLLTPLGYLLFFDWKLYPWQILAVVSALLSAVLVPLVNDVSGEFEIVQKQRDRELDAAAQRENRELEATALRKFKWIERLARVRFLLVLSLWMLVGGHMILWVNSQQCWFDLPSGAQQWAHWVYRDRLPTNACSAPQTMTAPSLK